MGFGVLREVDDKDKDEKVREVSIWRVFNEIYTIEMRRWRENKELNDFRVKTQEVLQLKRERIRWFPKK